LHTLKQHYRDHFFHTIEVCLMGFALLQSYPGPSTTERLVQEIINRCLDAVPGGTAPDEWSKNVPKKAEEFLAQWWVASLVHDVGYGVDILKGTLGLLGFLSNDGAVAAFRESVSKSVGELSKALRGLAGELKEGESLGSDHGVVAGAHLNATLKRMGNRAQQRFQPAIRAIAFHNTREPRVDAGRDPVAALLIMCDSLQEWRRAHLGFSQSAAVVLSRMIEAAAAPVEEQFGPVEQFRFSVGSGGVVDVQGRAHAEHRWESPDALEVRLDYNDRVLRDAAVFFLWIDGSYNLQRVDFRPWKLKLEVKYSTPTTARTRQIDRLADLVRDRGMKYAERWLEVASAGAAGAAVNHSLVGAARELLVLDLGKLGEEFVNGTPLLGGSTDDFFKDLWDWPPYAGERSLEDEYRQTPPV
jgi:hypothetical protein